MPGSEQDNAQPPAGDGPAETTKDMQPPASSAWGKLGSVLVGLVLLLVGLSMLEADVYEQTATRVGMASVLSALGMGIVATVLLPHSLEVSGKQFKPLGLDVKASGGAAVFIVVLAFLYFSNDKSDAADPGNKPETQETRTVDAGIGADTDETIEQTPDTQDTDTPPPPPASSPAQSTTQPPASQAYYYAETFCSDCCPNPSYCDQVGYGEGSTPERARQRAVQECQAAGGGPTCGSNVRVSLVEPDSF